MPKCNLSKVAQPIRFSGVSRGHQMGTLARTGLKALTQLVYTTYKHMKINFKVKEKELFDINVFGISSPYEHVLATYYQKNKKLIFFASIHEHFLAAIMEL